MTNKSKTKPFQLCWKGKAHQIEKPAVNAEKMLLNLSKALEMKTKDKLLLREAAQRKQFVILVNTVVILKEGKKRYF